MYLFWLPVIPPTAPHTCSGSVLSPAAVGVCILYIQHEERDIEFHIYHEGIGNKGQNEVCNFLNDYITNNIPETIKELHLFSNATGGQNRNNTVIRYLMTLVSSGRFEKVIQYYPVRGQSFLLCDCKFDVIKRHLKRIDCIYSLTEYAKKLVEASWSCNITSVLHNEIFSTVFKNWWQNFIRENLYL